MASTKKKRGASVPRSSFRAKANQAAPKKPAANKLAVNKPAAKKPAANKRVTPKKPAGSRSTPPTERNPSASGAKRTNRLGEVVIPSGTLAIFDVGLVGYLPREALEPAIVKASVPRDRPLAVIGTRVDTGRFRDCWDHVSVVLGEGELARSKKLGEAGVDFARLLLIDHAALDHWQHEDSLDGKADFVFWGKDEQILAQITGAKRTPEGYGWTDLGVADAEAKWELADRKKAENSWKLAIELRPHTHHFHALAAARANPNGAGTLELAGTTSMLLFTSWGDGVFPIYLDLDADEHPIRVRIQLATAASAAAMSAVNR